LCAIGTIIPFIRRAFPSDIIEPYLA
jgi:hypothetical protein